MIINHPDYHYLYMPTVEDAYRDDFPIISLIFNDTKKYKFPPTERSAMPQKITVFKEKIATLREVD